MENADNKIGPPNKQGGAPPSAYLVALIGNPNVGKSTVFNALTGLHQHTGNWPGKTVAHAEGRFEADGKECRLIDLPGAYSLLAHSLEEEVARDFLCFETVDTVIVVCDATCLERNLNLVLQVLEINKKTIVCVNLLDEAKKKNISIDLSALSRMLGVPVVGASARDGAGIDTLVQSVIQLCSNEQCFAPMAIQYGEAMEYALDLLTPPLERILQGKLPARFTAFRLLEGEEQLINSIETRLGVTIRADLEIEKILDHARAHLLLAGLSEKSIKDLIVSAIYARAEEIVKSAVCFLNPAYQSRQIKADRLLTGKWTGMPLMLLLLALVFYITLSGANAPSEALSRIFAYLESLLLDFFTAIHAPPWITNALILGMFRVVSTVVSVMLPPMAIFFPLFTLLEDVGYLPRVAFNLDHRFRRCNACGKQALTMCMGFGCNAVGVLGCRIIDSPRERLIAILTNSFVPCNGRFPALIALISMFFIGGAGGGFFAACLLALFILMSVFSTFLASWLLSKTLLKGTPSAFTLELPPYRQPQIGKVILRSVLDRTLFVLGRAIAIAAPLSLVIWAMANVNINGLSLLNHCSGFLDPFARVFGLDGVILMAFILGLPANEIVLPLIVMAYLAMGSMPALEGLTALKVLLLDNGWTWVTALCTLLFSMMHWPCSTTLSVIKKETGSLKWVAAAVILPTAFGLLACLMVKMIAALFGG